MPRGVIGLDIPTVRRILNLPDDYEITYMTGDSDGLQIHVVAPSIPCTQPCHDYEPPHRPWPLRVQVRKQLVAVPLAEGDVPDVIDRDWRQDVWVVPLP